MKESASSRTIDPEADGPGGATSIARLARRLRSLAGSNAAMAVAVGLIALAVYLRTLAVSIAWGDSPELTAAAWRAGVPHPTGYPLYMLLGYAFTHLCPWGSVAQRMNLLSALSAAGAVSLVYLLAWRLTHARWASALSALSLAFSQTFWSQAVIAEVYAFHLLLMAGVLGLVLTWERRGERRYLRLAAVAYGLCCTHHLLSGLLLPGLLVIGLGAKRREQFVRELRWTVPLFLLPLCLYAYLPLVSARDLPVSFADLRSWSALVEHVTGKVYRAGMFHMTGVQLGAHLADYLGVGARGHAGYLPAQFGVGLLVLVPLGLWSLARRRRRLLGLTGLIYLVTVIYALNYNIYDVEIYYLPSHMMVALWIACGLRQAGVWLGLLWRKIALPPAKRGPFGMALGVTLWIAPLTLLASNWSVNDHHDDWSALVYARAALAGLKPNALLLTEGDRYYFPLMYARYVEGRRLDVTLQPLYDITVWPPLSRPMERLAAAGLTVQQPPCFRAGHPGRHDHNCLLKRLIDDNVLHRPIYVLGSPELLRQPGLAAVIAPYHPLATTSVPSLELSATAPRLAAVAPHRPARAVFGSPRRDGSLAPGLELLAWDTRPHWEGGVPWLKVSYLWRVRNRAVAGPARVWALFTDASGNYRREEDGSPEFHNIHPFAYGTGRDGTPLPSVLCESYDLYVPPGEWNHRLRLRIAVASGERFLSTGTRENPWVELGEIPVAPGADGIVSLAARQ